MHKNDQNRDAITAGFKRALHVKLNGKAYWKHVRALSASGFEVEHVWSKKVKFSAALDYYRVTFLNYRSLAALSPAGLGREQAETRTSVSNSASNMRYEKTFRYNYALMSHLVRFAYSY